MKWWHISALLCSYGFLKEFRPSEPFISSFLTRFKNLTVEEVNEKMYPVGTYTNLSVLIVIFLLTDLLRYKPILIAGSLSGVVTWCLLIWGKTITAMQVVELFYGFFMASEVAYYTYIYAKVDKTHYQKVTSHTRAAFLLGKASAGVSSQILVYWNFNYLELNYFTVLGVAATVPIALFLPSVPQSLYFHREKSDKSFKDYEISSEDKWNEKEGSDGTKINGQFFRNALSRLYTDFKESFTNLYVVQWSIWWALATCGYLQAVSYYQLLWETIIQDDNATLYHGYVEFAASILGAGIAFGIGYLKVPWIIWGEVFLGVLTLCQGGFLYYSAFLKNLYFAYAVHMAYKLFYDAAITVATYEIAKFINDDSYALVFGINTFVALGVQTLLTLIVIDTLKLNIRVQYQVYGAYHFVIGTAFLLYGFYHLLFSKRRGKTNNRIK